MTVPLIIKLLRSLVKPGRKNQSNLPFDYPEERLGLSKQSIKELAKELEPSRSIAEQLWNAGLYEAKLLSVWIDEPDQITSDALDQHAQDAYTKELALHFAQHLVSKTPFLLEKTNTWTQMGADKSVRRVGYLCAAQLAKKSKVLDNNYFEKHLTIIENNFGFAKPITREGQIEAVLSIGSRNKVLNEKSIDLSKKLLQKHRFVPDLLEQMVRVSAALSSDKVQRW
ncbi:MAG: DNA alkylation repair protein [Bacteroidota bacterium]